MLTSPVLWGALMLSIAIPAIFLVSARYLAFRIAGRPSAAHPHSQATTFPQVTIRWRSIATLLIFLILSAGTLIMLLRFVFGIGPVSNLSDSFPWGIWIGFDVMGGVALAAGAFVIAATAHIFNKKRFEPLVRPAILTGFLGYLLVVCGLIIDLGRPYNIWRPLAHWQHHSVMWEVGMCVALYTTVLLIEFLPVILERVNKFETITSHLPTVSLHRLLKRVAIVFVILGVILSTLHQSSLGSLWVLVPSKLYPLWYSIYLPVFFWLSAVAVGLAMTIVESTLSSRAMGRGLELDLLADLAKWAAIVLAIYLVAKVSDLASRQALPLLFQPNVQAAAFWLEIGLGVIVPMLMFANARLRRKPSTLFLGATMIVLFGIVLNRLNIATVGMWTYAGVRYLPSWMELTVTATLVGFGVIAFALAAKHLPVFADEHDASH
ncbi:MAG: Ni/Fe-hydrogenase cytochrome b subunit [Chloroflexi bacterium]|nr:Ni/Fe-hydrogenase cytochrome b subunit [Chloroflexota bacterium]